MDDVNKIFDLLGTSPFEANQFALKLLADVKSQEQKDSINWARAYALVELKEFDSALDIWKEIFGRTNSHKALHQVGFVYRSTGKLSEAIKVFLEENKMISKDDIHALAVNLYELCYCNHLLGKYDAAVTYFSKYEQIKLEEIDLIERGCFYRLKGNLYQKRDKNLALEAYRQSMKFFEQAGDLISVKEVKELITAVL